MAKRINGLSEDQSGRLFLHARSIGNFGLEIRIYFLTPTVIQASRF